MRSYLDERMEFPLGSTLLSGDVGSGKSTILQAVEFAFFGIRRGELAGSHLLRHGQDYGYVELNLSIDGKDVRIKRALRRSSNIVQDACNLEIDGVKKDYMPTELKARILELFGYPKEVLTKNIPIFRYTVYTPQEEMKRIMLDSENRLSILRKVFNVDKYGQIRANVRIFLSELRSMKRFLDDYTKDLDKLLQDKNAKEKDIETAGNAAAEVSTDIDSINSAVDEITEKIGNVRKEIDALYTIKSTASTTEAELRAQTSRKAQVERDIIRYDEKISSLLSDVSKYPAIKAESGDGIKENISGLEHERLDIASQIAVLADGINKMKGILESGRCAVCGQPVHDVKEFQSAIGERILLKEQCRNRLDAVELSIKEARAHLEELEHMRLQAERRRHLEKLLADAGQNKKELNEEKLELESEIENSSKKIALLSARLQAFETVDKEYKEMESRLEVQRRNKLLKEKEKSRLEQELRNLQGMVRLLDEEIEKRTTAKARILLVNEIYSWLESHFIVLMDVIEKNVMARIHREFVSLFQKWFDTLMQDELLSVRLDENFSPVIQQNGYETEYENLSGGEKTSVALAYRLALNKVINDLVETIKTKDILILDEPTDGFSSEQLDRIRDVINELKLKQIIIVSHETKIDTFVDNVIRLHKDQHVSKIVR